MYAIVRSGGKQYRVKAGDVLRVEKLNKSLGDEFELPEVLWVGGAESFSGDPVLSDAKVVAVVTHQTKAAKVLVFKKKRRQGYRRMQGHRQWYTELFIKSITNPKGEVSNADKEARVFDPVKKEEALAQKKAEKKEAKSATGTKEPVKKTKKTKTKAKAKAKKAKTKKKASSKKKTTAKKSAAKKTTAKKKSTKKAPKKS